MGPSHQRNSNAKNARLVANRILTARRYSRGTPLYTLQARLVRQTHLYKIMLGLIYTRSTAILVFNLSYTGRHGLLGTTLTLYVFFAAFVFIAHRQVLSYRPTNICASIAVRFFLILKFPCTFLIFFFSSAMHRLLD